MQTPNRDGISCDLCNTVYKDDFKYYSFDLRRVEGGRYSYDQIKLQDICQSIDVCTLCMAEIKPKIIQHNKVPPPKGQIKDELDGSIINISKPYYYVNVTFAQVRITGQPNICVNCQQSTFDKGKPCSKCGNNNFVNLAATDTYDDFVEFYIAENSFTDLTKAIKKNDNQPSNWSTSS